MFTHQDLFLFFTFVCVSKSDSKLKYLSAFVLLPKLHYPITTYSNFFLDFFLFVPSFELSTKTKSKTVFVLNFLHLAKSKTYLNFLPLKKLDFVQGTKGLMSQVLLPLSSLFLFSFLASF